LWKNKPKYFRFFFAFSPNLVYAGLRRLERPYMDFQKALIAEFDRETATTRKVLGAIPDSADFTWKPHDKSMPLGKLAGHVSDTNGDWPSTPSSKTSSRGIRP